MLEYWKRLLFISISHFFMFWFLHGLLTVELQRQNIKTCRSKCSLKIMMLLEYTKGFHWVICEQFAYGQSRNPIKQKRSMYACWKLRYYLIKSHTQVSELRRLLFSRQRDSFSCCNCRRRDSQPLVGALQAHHLWCCATGSTADLTELFFSLEFFWLKYGSIDHFLLQ